MRLWVNEWEKWQSFRKDRGAPPWIKVYRDLLTDDKWAQLADADKAHLLAIWILAVTREGEVPTAVIVKKLGGFDSMPDLEKLHKVGFLTDVPPQKRAAKKPQKTTTCQPLDNHLTTTCQPLDRPETETETETEKRAYADSTHDILTNATDAASSIHRRAYTREGILNFDASEAVAWIPCIKPRNRAEEKITKADDTGGWEMAIPQAWVNEWHEVYSRVDIEATLREIRQRIRDSGKWRKTPAGVRRFIGNWLARENDRA